MQSGNIKSASDLDYKDPFKVRVQDVKALSRDKYPLETIRSQKAVLEGNALLRFAMDAVPQMIMILNSKMQFVLGNQNLHQTLGIAEPDSVLGKRLGDILDCIHAYGSSEGCGTTQFCQFCGSFKALMNSQTGETKSEEYRIIQKAGEHNIAMDLRVSSSPFTFQDWDFIFLHLTDISQEKRKQALERVFFHDILNSVGAIKGTLDVIAQDNVVQKEEEKEFVDLALQQSRLVIEDIQTHKVLSAAEAYELQVNPSLVNSLELLKHSCFICSAHPEGQDRTVSIARAAEDLDFVTDYVLLGRVLGNMLKNALEASSPGENVQTGCLVRNNRAVFWVKNAQVIPEEVQLQIFKRSFSTKGKGRGLGTHSIKLLTEEYLQGKVWFISDHKRGTIFYVALPLTDSFN